MMVHLGQPCEPDARSTRERVPSELGPTTVSRSGCIAPSRPVVARPPIRTILRDALAKLAIFLVGPGLLWQVISPVLQPYAFPHTLLFALLEEVARAWPVRRERYTRYSVYLVLGVMVGLFEGVAAGSPIIALTNSICHSVYGLIYESLRRRFPGPLGVTTGVGLATLLHLSWNLLAYGLDWPPVPYVLVIILVGYSTYRLTGEGRVRAAGEQHVAVPLKG